MRYKYFKSSSAKTFSAFLFLIFSIVCLSSAAAQKKTPKTSAPKNVIDFLKILPESYSQIIARNPRADRISLIKYDRRENDFVRLGAENFMGYAEIALFKRKSGGHIIAVNEYAQDKTCCDGGVKFYEYSKGKWKEIEPLPAFTYGDLLTAFHGKTNRPPTEEEMDQQMFELNEPTAGEITLQIGGVAVYGFRWNGSDFDGGMLYLLDENQSAEQTK